ncbi:ribonuclease YeeF family protein [Actinomycetes bacterium NPDC127524]
MSMKIYDAKALFHAAGERSKQYRDLREQLNELKKGFSGIVELDDELKGNGAAAIKGFYRAQMDTADVWIALVDRHIAFLNGIEGDAQEAKLGGDSIVEVPFLDGEVAHADRKSKELVAAQKSDLAAIFSRIEDIIHLEPFSDEEFQEQISEADRKRFETIDKVNETDSGWLEEYAESEADQAAIVSLLAQLRESSSRGGKVSPLYFDAKSYQNSEVYKELQERKKENTAYLKIKKEEAEKRRIEELKAKLATVTNPEEFLEIANVIGMDNLPPEQQQIVIQLEMSKQNAEIAKGIGAGLYDAGKDLVTGIWDFVKDPGAAIESTVTAIAHPIKTYNYISKAISDSFERDMVHGDAYSRAHWVSYALGTVVSSVVGTKGAGAVAKTGMATSKAAVIQGVTKAKTIDSLLPYAPANRLAASGVPFNAVNGAELEKQLLSMAKVETDLLDKGVVKSRLDYLRDKHGTLTPEELHDRINTRGEIEKAINHGSRNTWNDFFEASKEGNKSVEQIKNSYINLIKEQSPWPEGFTPVKSVLKSGDTFEMVLDNKQPLNKPGSFGTYDTISGVEYAKNKLAIKSDWKEDFGKVVTYRVKQGVELPVLKGPVGPQIDLAADKYLPGGGTQLQIMLDWKEDKMKYLEIVSVRPNK